MNGQIPFRISFSDGETILRLITESLEETGLRVVKSFDLWSACGSLNSNVCSHHGNAPCDCRLVVLLLFGLGAKPVSLVLHSHQGQTEMQWDEAPDARPNLEQRAFILQALNGKTGIPLYLDENTYAEIE